MTEPDRAEMLKKARRRLPSWGIILIAVVVVGAGLIWAGGLYDAKGNSYLNAGTVQILIALIGAVVTMFAVLLNRQSEQQDHLRETNRRLEHEFTPNHGTSLRDSNDRIEQQLKTLIDDVGGLRQENRNDRQATETRFALVEGRVHDLEIRKGTS